MKKPKNVDIGPRIRLDDERCIMCSRCIRFCDEIAEDHGARVHGSGQPHHADGPSRARAGEQLLAEHGGYLPGGSADLERLPLSDAGVVSEGDGIDLHEMRSRLQHGDQQPGERGLPADPAAERRR